MSHRMSHSRSWLCWLQEKQDGKPKAGQLTAQFCSMVEALQAPWGGLRPKRTHDLYYGLRGRAAASSC